ncbi:MULTISPECIES: phage tail protein [unclassified Burkholderia]|uniref:phage tail protein n=1 Tax=unclassified Burkholderia TaxID=2613784 RepID=UPI000F57887D|nr:MULTISPECIES: phage tail protein [unclassified Burkholderia]RQR45592.1 hypothetical protein DIE20_04935 [Burkholderia sp. Bp9131]RQR77679.1 hypothetical protein DIE12_05270 [Burkholderia sp. Bp9015]
MADLKEESKWEPGIRQFETSDPVQGGPDGVDNIALKQLGNRTRYLKDRADGADKVVAGKLDKSGGKMTGALLGKAGEIAPNNPKNVGYAFDGDPDSGMFSPADGHVQVGAQGVPYVVMLDNNLTLGARGWLSLIAGGAERGRITPQGRWLVGGAADNGKDALRVQGIIGTTGGVRSAGYDSNNGAQFRAVGTEYGVMLRNDNKSAWLLSTNKGDPEGAYNDFRPFSWALDTGAVRIDGTGCGAVFGGYARFAGNVECAGVGYFGGGAGNAKTMGSGVTLGANTGGDVVLRAAGAGKDMKMWDIQSNNESMSIRALDDDWTIGTPAIRIMRADQSTSIRTVELAPNSGRVLSGGAWDDGRSSFQNKGALKSTNSVGALVASNGGGAGQTSIQLVREGAPVDQKTWEVLAGAAGELSIRTVNDGYVGSQSAINIGRAAGYTLGMMRLMAQGGRVGIGNVNDDASNLLQVGGGVSVTSRVALTSKQANIEMGSTTEAGTPYIDFHSSGAPRDYDARIIAKGGDATADGTGNLQYLAGRHSFLIGSTEKVTINSAGRVLIGSVADNGSALLQVGGTVTATAPPAGDNSDKLITSAWFAAAVANVQIGQIVWEARTAPRVGFLKLNGTVLKRADYPLLWAYAQASGAIVSDADWGKGRHGCFSSGDGNTTFRLPDLRGEFVRCWDDARGVDAQRQIGSWQDSQNRSHAHGASASAVGDHSHSAWTDAQGVHAHGVHDPGHAHNTRIGRVGVVGTSYGQGSGPYNWDRGDDVGSSVSGTGIWIAADGNHGHNVGIGAAGAHSHTISVAADGGNETRPRNVALLAMIRAY